MRQAAKVDMLEKSKNSSKNAFYFLGKAQAALKEENLPLVMKNLIQAHKIEPGEIEILRAMLEIQEKLGHWTQMLPILDLLIKLQPDEIKWPICRLATLQSCEAFETLVEESLLLLKLYPRHIKILTLLASAYYELNNFSLALNTVNTLIEFNLGTAEPFVIRGLIYMTMGDRDRAKIDLLKAESFGEKTILIFNALGAFYAGVHEHETALAYYGKALSLAEGSYMTAKIALNASRSAMSLGKFDIGWQLYAYRKTDIATKFGTVMKETIYPVWQGEKLVGKHLVIRREQGLGDELRFSSVIAEVADEAKLVTLECDPRLVDLYQRSFPNNVKPVGIEKIGAARNLSDSYVEVNAAAYIGDLSHYKRQTLDDFPEHYGYLTPDPKRVDFWTDYLEKLEGKINVGVCWKSANVEGSRRNHYTNIKHWLPVFAIEGINFVNLYYGDSEEDLKWVEAQTGVKVLTPEGIDLRNDIDELSALIASVDLVVGANTAPIELSMAVRGASTWMLPFRHFDTKDAFYFGQAYYPWAPAAKPIFGDGFQKTMDLVAEELAYVMQTKNPRHTLVELSKIMYVCYGAL